MPTKAPANAVKVEVRYDQSEQTKLATLGPKLVKQLQSVEIKDQATLDRLAEFVLAADAWIKGVEDIMDPVRKATHDAWKASIKAADDFMGEVVTARQLAKQSINRYIVAAREAADKKQRDLDAAQARINQQNADAQAKLAKKAGADTEAIKEVRTAALAAPAPLAAPKATAPKGMKTPSLLYRGKITNMRAFVSGLLTDGTMFNLMLKSEGVIGALESELSKLTTMQKDAFSFPGVELVKKYSGTGE